MTSEQIVYLIVFLVFIALLLTTSIIISKKNKSGEDFLMGGRGISSFLIIGTTLATLVGTGSSMGAVQYAYENGWAGALYGIGGAVGIFALAFLFTDVRKLRFMTFSEELSYYFGASKIIKGATSVLLYFASIGWLGAHILGGSLYLSYITGLNPTTSKLLVALGFALLTIIGGYLSVVVTDTIQAFILFFGFIILTILSIVKIGGLSEIHASMPTDTTSFLGIDHVGVFPAVSLAVSIAIGVLATPSYRQRIYSAKSASSVKKSFLITGVLFAIFSFFPAIAGMSAHVLNADIEAGFSFPYLATEVFPLWIGAIILISGLSATISSGSSDYIVAITILLRDVYQLVTGKTPSKENVIRYSRISLVVTIVIAFGLVLLTSNIIEFIESFISTVLAGLFVASLLGKYWPRANWQGGLASMISGSIISIIILSIEPLIDYFGNPVIPSMIGALVFGVIVTLITPEKVRSKEESLRILDEERAMMDVGTEAQFTKKENIR
ncbi:sodium:solute symporter family protein [Virgibacillus sp. NKC19-3]|uniref:sodium:solute symporter family protein n=1 Tax=Virgibacillus saliphilus TaxID=2831674 RepID=UPI001C9B26C5|nr:sodium:solute symporter family protein [Virgibacillus sp. NKC19-3]MBY7141763.1 sodium:solute symporter family protein [Virgibacillus sp. NKC19-3]